MPDIKLCLGDCVDVLQTLHSESTDAIITDPPAGIAFMGKEWDKDKGGRDQWIEWMVTIAAECLRVLKPGGHALVWSLPRTSHWTATAWENAGFEVRDRIAHIFGSGFPKSLDVGKAIDKAAGAEREVVGEKGGDPLRFKKYKEQDGCERSTFNNSITSPAAPEVEQWDGWGTALKPAVEDWWLLRKPLSEKTVAANVLRWGTGALNIDACRVGTETIQTNRYNEIGDMTSFHQSQAGNNYISSKHQGRFPAHLIHDGSQEVMELFPMTGKSAGGGMKDLKSGKLFQGDTHKNITDSSGFGDSGSVARFFYCAKPSKRERGDGNGHPTVKSLALMRYLITLITPPGGTVLDCFMGSGTTGKAAKELGFPFIGIECNLEYFSIAEKRIHA